MDDKSIIDQTIRRENSYINHPTDRGGPDKYNITQATRRTGTPNTSKKSR